MTPMHHEDVRRGEAGLAISLGCFATCHFVMLEEWTLSMTLGRGRATKKGKEKYQLSFGDKTGLHDSARS